MLTDLKSDPVTRDYPVIICSIMEQADRGFSLGAADYLVKPILEEDLVSALNRLNKDGTIHEVLVIDDDPNDLRLIEKILNEHRQYKLTLAEGGRKGWEAINQKIPHAIILDLFMPEMDGFTILEKLRENSILRDVPVLVVSGGGLTNARSAGPPAAAAADPPRWAGSGQPAGAVGSRAARRQVTRPRRR